MPLADVVLSTESMVVVGGLVLALAGAVSLLFRLLMAAKDAQLSDMTSQRNSYKEMANESINNLEDAINTSLVASGKPVTSIVAAVIPEHSSPTTIKQQDSADLQTMRARLVAASLAFGLPARRASEPAVESGSISDKAG